MMISAAIIGMSPTMMRGRINNPLRLPIDNHFGTVARRFDIDPTNYFVAVTVGWFLVSFDNDHLFFGAGTLDAFLDNDFVDIVVIMLVFSIAVLVIGKPVGYLFDDDFSGMILPCLAYRNLPMGKTQSDFGMAIGCVIVIGPRLVGKKNA